MEAFRGTFKEVVRRWPRAPNDARVGRELSEVLEGRLEMLMRPQHGARQPTHAEVEQVQALERLLNDTHMRNNPALLFTNTKKEMFSGYISGKPTDTVQALSSQAQR